MKNKIFAILVRILCFVAVSLPPPGAQHHGKRRITDAEVKAVIQAVEDEIYDCGYQEEYADVDAPEAEGRNAMRVRIYINPEIDADGTRGEVIYKLMPYGEVFRDYGILDSGLAVLDGNPENQFPPTEEYARKTVYMDEDLVFRMKRHWLKSFFVVNESPDPKTVAEASRRQKQRTGYSAREAHSKTVRKSPHHN